MRISQEKYGFVAKERKNKTLQNMKLEKKIIQLLAYEQRLVICLETRGILLDRHEKGADQTARLICAFVFAYAKKTTKKKKIGSLNIELYLRVSYACSVKRLIFFSKFFDSIKYCDSIITVL